MPGQVKAGRGTLVGNAGEYFVVAELLKRGKVAALAPRNTPAFDILATDGDRMVRIRVKTKSEEYTDWQWMAKKDGAIFGQLDPGATDDFMVLVNLRRGPVHSDCFVVPTAVINDLLIADYSTWLVTPGHKGRVHNPHRKRHINCDKYAGQLGPYQEAWDSLWRE